MNRIYKVIWSKTKHCYVVVSELAKRHTKGGSAGGCRMMTARVLSTLLLGAYLVGGYSLPSAWAEDIEADKITAGSIDVGDGQIAAGSIIVGDVNAAGTITAGSLNVVGAGGRINTETGEFNLGNGFFSISIPEAAGSRYSMAIGEGSNANAGNSVAMLGGTTATDAENSLAIGRGAQAILSDSIALGSGAVADRAKYDASNNAYTAYLGDDTGTTKTGSAWRATANAIAIGHIDTDDTKSVTRQIIGVAAGTEDTDAVNVAQLKAATFNVGGITRDGKKTTIEQGFTVQTNSNSGSSDGYMNVYWGQGTLATGVNATAWGWSTVASSPLATAWGNEAKAKGDQATAFGSRTIAYGVNSTAWGADTVAFSHQATAFGENTTAGGQRATAWGHNTTAGGDSSTAYGKNTSALMEGATAWGNNTKAGKWTYDGHDAVIKPYPGNGGLVQYKIEDAVTGVELTNGFDDYIDAYNGLSSHQGVYSTAWGNGTQATGDYSTAFGNYTKTAGVTSLKYNGQEAKVVSEQVRVLDEHGNPIPLIDPETKEPSDTEFKTETKYKIVDAANPDNKLYESYFDTEDAAMKYLVQNGTITGGYGATAFGLLSEAKGAHSTAFGVQTVAEGTGATAWGNSTTASGKGATASGYGTKAEGDYSTAFGSNTKATGDNSTAFGSSTKATGSSSTAFGSITEANGPSGTAFGSSTMANGQHSTAFGSSSIAAGDNSTAFGSHTQAGKLTYKKADGRETEAKIVEYTTAAGIRRYKIVDLLDEDDVLSDNNGAGFNMYESAFLDKNLTRQGDYSTAFGSSTIALGDYSTAWGFSAQANGDYSTAFGYDTEASGTGATAWGSSTKALGTYSTAFGNGSVANAYNSLAALGGTTGEKATNSVAIGTGATVGGAYDSENQQTEGANAFAFGNGAQATLSDSVALGSGAVANRAKYNASNNAYKAYLNEDDNNQKTDPAWRATHNAIAVGASATDSDTATVTRQITGVAAGTYDTDAVNVAQLKAATVDLDNIQGINRRRNEEDDGFNTTIEGTFSVWDDGRFGTSNFAVDKDGAFNAAGGKFSVDENGNTTAAGTLSAGATTVSELTVGEKNRTVELITDGEVTDGDAGAGYVKGSTVYSAMNTKLGDYAKLDGTNLDAAYAEAWGAIGTGAVESGNGKLVTGDTVFAVTNALSDRIGTIASDGNYISASGSVSENLISLDNQVKANTSDITVAALNEGSYGYISAGHDVAGNLIALDNAVKANAGAIQGVERTGNATDGFTTTIEGKLSVSSNGTFSISGDKFTVDSNGAISAAGGKFTVGADGTLSAKATTVSELTVGDSGKVTVGSATLNTDGLAISGGPSVTSDGIDAGGKKITNVLKGEAGTDAVTVEQLHEAFDAFTTTGGTALGFGKGIAKNNDILEVNAGEGLTFADNGALKVNAGGGLTIDAANENALKVNAGEGLTIDTENGNVLKVNKGTITSGDEGEGFVTGKTVFNALSAYAKSDGATLTNATISTGSIITEEVMLGTGETAVPVGTVRALNETVNGPDGLVEKVADNTREIGVNAGNISDLQGITQKITLSEGTTTISGALSAGATKVSGLTVGDRNVTEALTTTGSVAEDNKGFVSGGTVFAVTSALDTRLDTAEGNLTTAGENITALQAKTQNITLSEGTTTISGALSAGATTVSGLTVGDRNVTEALTTTGSVAEDNKGFVSGGTVFAVTSALDTRLTTAEGDIATNAGDIATLQTTVAGKANANLDNISDKGKVAVRSLISVAQGNNVIVTKSTSDAGVDTYTISAADGVTYSAGDGIAISDTNAISVTANGAVEEKNTGIVTGGTVYNALQAFKPDGKVEEGNAKAVSGDTVFTAIETAKTDVNAATETNIAKAKTEISSDVDTKLGSYAKTDGATLNNATLTGATTVTSLTDGTATLSGGALTGVTTITASGAINGGSLNVGGMATVTGLTIDGTNVTTALTTTGAVAENNAGFVTGGVVYSALQAYQPDGEIAEGNTKAVSGGTVYKVTSGLDARIKTNAEAIATKADASTVTELSGKVTANEAAIKTNADAIATKADASTVTELSGKVTANEAAIKTNADAIATKADASTVTELSGKVTANEAAIKTNADNITTLTGKVTANETAIKTNATNIAANTKNITANTEAIASNKKAIEANTKNITANTDAIASNKKAIEKNTSDITSLSTKVTANETAIKTNADNIATNTKNISANTEAISSNKSAIEKNAGDITALGKKVTANETALAQKADKANTLQGYGIEDAYTKEDSDTLLNKKADKTEFEAVKVVVGDTNSGLVKDVNDLKNSILITEDESGAKTTVIDGNLVIKEEDGTTKDVTAALTTDGKVEENNHGYVDGDKVYDYLNKGENGEVKLAGESKQIAMGQGSEASGSESISIGNEVGGQKNEASGTQSIAIGFGNKVTGSHSGAFGDPNTVTGANSYAFGNDNYVSGSNTFVLGNNVNTSATNAVVLGDGSVGVDNAVSVGAPGNERQIKNVAPGTEATDAATVGQVQEVAQGAYNNAVYLSNSMNKLDNRVNKVGAGAAALAALHPIDTDDKFTMGLGYGNYRSAHAMAMGMFYRPTEKIMISVGGAFGNGENMVNAGISFALDKGKGFGTSKAVMAKNIKALSAENAAIKEENAGMKKQLDAQGQEIAALKEALARLEAKIGK